VSAPLLLSFDFEDWHQLVHRTLGRADWDTRGAALERQTETVLDLLDELGVKATFFMLGITVRRYPDLAQEIVRRGHEPATHGFAHERVFRQAREEFRLDVEESIELIEQTCGRRPVAYRAPAFSINRRTPWAYEVLADLGFRCDSSQYDSPRIPERIGRIPDAPYRLRLNGNEIWELPVATWGPVPIGGGSYWHALPTSFIRRGLREFSVLYFHPYEFAPDPLRATLPPSPTARQRAIAAGRSAWRNTGRRLVARRLREIARHYRLVSYDQAYDDLARRYGTRTRALSQEGVLV